MRVDVADATDVGGIELAERALLGVSAAEVDPAVRGRGLPDMIRIAITPAAYAAIATALRPGTRLLPIQQQGGPPFHLWLKEPVLDRLRAMRGPGEDYSEVIMRIARLEAGGS